MGHRAASLFFRVTWSLGAVAWALACGAPNAPRAPSGPSDETDASATGASDDAAYDGRAPMVDPPVGSGGGVRDERGPMKPSDCDATLFGKCKHLEIGEAHLCYGTNPGPNAPHSRRECVCHECSSDATCGQGKRCAWTGPRCGAPRRMCAEPCKNGTCPAGYLCGDGACVPVPGAPPP